MYCFSWTGLTHLRLGCVCARNFVNIACVLEVLSIHRDAQELSLGCVMWLLALIWISLGPLCPYVGRLPASPEAAQNTSVHC